jgi:hypothetical protein
MYNFTPNAGMARKASLFLEINIDVRFMIYDCIVEQNRFIQIPLREEQRAGSGGSGDEEEDGRDGDQEANQDSLQSLSDTHPELKLEISHYIRLYKLQRSPRYGFFDPKSTVFSLDVRNALQVDPYSNETTMMGYVVPEFRRFTSVESHAQHAWHVSFDVRFPTVDAKWADPVTIFEDNPLMLECSRLKQLCSIEIVITEDIVARWKQDERAREIEYHEPEGSKDGAMEWILWTIFWVSLRKTCPPSAVCTCCVLPDFKLRVVGERLGQERMMPMPNFTYRPTDGMERGWYGLVGGASSCRQAAELIEEIEAFRVFRDSICMAE